MGGREIVYYKGGGREVEESGDRRWEKVEGEG
jgi:hypothetical protein